MPTFYRPPMRRREVSMAAHYQKLRFATSTALTLLVVLLLIVAAGLLLPKSVHDGGVLDGVVLVTFVAWSVSTPVLTLVGVVKAYRARFRNLFWINAALFVAWSVTILIMSLLH